MTFIEGIGDEVTEFFIAISVIAIVCIAWHTTDIRQQWNIRTVYLLNRRRMRHVTRNQRLTNHTESATISEGRASTSSLEDVPEEVVQNAEGESGGDQNKPPEEQQSTSNVDASGESPVSSEEDEQNDIIETMDGDTYEVRRRRVAFYQTHTEPLLFEDIPERLEISTNVESQNNPSIMEHNYAEIPQEINNTSTTTTTTSTTRQSNTNDSNITIKLKYINDDLKLVEGRLQECLGDFKRRHFQMEISSNKLVRLIFNGHVLQRDGDTLQSCGMFDNCVVHCLVHQQRVDANNGGDVANINLNINNSAIRNNNNNNHRDWDLGNLLLATVSFSLGSAWYLRYQYPQLFTITATIGLVAITGIFSVISIGLYFPDADAQIPQQPRPAQPPTI